MFYSSKYLQVDENDITKRLVKINSVGLQDITTLQAMKIILGSIDLTTLEGSDTNERVIELCRKAKTFSNQGENIPNVAAVCVYPPFVKLAKNELISTGIHVASVAGAFPAGQSPLHIKIAEINYAIEEGADEIDMVISRGKFLEGEYNLVFDEIAAIREVCKDVHLKVILETGELVNYTNIALASAIAMDAGADFIKTSTGKMKPAATPQAVLVMADAIKGYYEKTGKMVGIKAAGGISEPNDALIYLMIVKDILGESWLNKALFRFGASRLADKVLAEIIALSR